MTISIVPTVGLKNIVARVNLVLPGVGIVKDITIVDAGKGAFVSNPSRVYTGKDGVQHRVDVVQLDASLKASILAKFEESATFEAVEPVEPAQAVAF